MRFLHKTSGRLLLGLAFATCALGWSTVQKQALLPARLAVVRALTSQVALFSLPLIVFMKAQSLEYHRVPIRVYRERERERESSWFA